MASKNHFFKKINFLKKKKIIKCASPKPNSKKNPLIFYHTHTTLVNKPSYVSKLITNQLL